MERRRRRRKNNLGKIFIFLCLLAVVIFCVVKLFDLGTTSKAEETKATRFISKIEITNVIREYKKSSINVDYPITKNDEVNTVLEKFADEIVFDFQANNTSGTKKNKDELKIAIKEIYEFGTDIYSFIYVIDMHKTKTDTKTSETKTMVFNIKKGNQLGLKDVFAKENYLEVLSKKAYSKFKSRVTVDTEEFDSGTAAREENFENFALEPTKIKFFFNAEQLGESFQTAVDMSVEYESLGRATFKEMIAKRYEFKEMLIPDISELKGKKLVALTFDDGPHGTYTPELLNTLKQEGVRATFFVLGTNSSIYPDILKRMVAEGHQVASHTQSHQNLSSLSEAGIIEEVNTARDIITNATGKKPTALRPPYGAYNDTVKRLAGASVIMWSVDTQDWRSQNPDAIYNEVMSSTRDGSIILMHDIYSTTVEAAKRVIPKLKADGYTFVTVDELIASRGKLVAGEVYFDAYPN